MIGRPGRKRTCERIIGGATSFVLSEGTLVDASVLYDGCESTLRLVVDRSGGVFLAFSVRRQ